MTGPYPGQTDLGVLLATMRPAVRDGTYVVVSLAPDAVAAARADGVDPEATVREAEGLTYVVRQEVADGRGWSYADVLGWVTLQVHSSLAAVGLTAAVSAALAAEDIACNVLAGYFHDHLLVPVDRVGDAVAALERLAGTP